MTTNTPNPIWVDTIKEQQSLFANEQESLISKDAVKETLKSDVVLHDFMDPVMYASLVAFYLIFISFVSGGQQHMDWGVPIAVYTFFTTVMQFISTIFCAYYWKKLRGAVTHKMDENKILIFTTASTILFFKMSLDVYFIQCYASLYDTQSVVDTFAQRQFDALFNLINIAVVSLLPYALFFVIRNWTGGLCCKPKSD